MRQLPALREVSTLGLRFAVAALTALKRARMRVRITQRLSGSIDGIQLSRFVNGLTYDVGTTLANYLLAEGLAVPVDESTPALVLPIQDDSELKSEHPPSEAQDRPRRVPRRRPRR
jgi:hypothetical protein